MTRCTGKLGNGTACQLHVHSDVQTGEVVVTVWALNPDGTLAANPRAIVRMELPANAFFADAVLKAGQGMLERGQHAERLAQMRGGHGRA